MSEHLLALVAVRRQTDVRLLRATSRIYDQKPVEVTHRCQYAFDVSHKDIRFYPVPEILR